MEEQGHAAQLDGKTRCVVEENILLPSVVGVLIAFVVTRYVLGLQPAPASYILIGGTLGGLLGNFRVMTSRYTPIEGVYYRSPRWALVGRLTGAVFWASLWTWLFPLLYTHLWGYNDPFKDFLPVFFFGSGTISYASRTRDREYALLNAGGFCGFLLMTVAHQLEFLPQFRITIVAISLLFFAGGLGLFFRARRRTKRESSRATDVGQEGRDTHTQANG